MRRIPLLLAVMVLALGSARAFAMVGVEVKLWMPELETDVDSTTDDLDGTDVSLEGDLNMDSEDDVVMFKVMVGVNHRITFSYMELKFSGDDRPDIRFNFSGETYTTGVDVETELEATVYRLAWEADWWHTPNFRLGTIIGTQFFETSVSVENDIVGKEKLEVDIPVPILGLQGEVGLPVGLGIYGEVAGLYVGYANFEGGFIEWELGLKYSFAAGQVYVMAGYRELRVDLEEDEDRTELDLHGFIFGIGAKF
jgi:hypothetical protein